MAATKKFQTVPDQFSIYTATDSIALSAKRIVVSLMEMYIMESTRIGKNMVEGSRRFIVDMYAMLNIRIAREMVRGSLRS